MEQQTTCFTQSGLVLIGGLLTAMATGMAVLFKWATSIIERSLTLAEKQADLIDNQSRRPA